MDYAYSQSAYNPSEEQNKETLELLRLGNNDKILLMSYVSIQSFFDQPHRDWDRLITQVKAPPEELSLFQGAWNLKLELIMPISAGLREDIAVYGGFIGQQ